MAIDFGFGAAYCIGRGVGAPMPSDAPAFIGMNRRPGPVIVAKPKWYESGLKFSCTQCGNCCSGDPGYVWATKDEIKKISDFLGRADSWLPKTQLRRVGLRYSLTEKPDGDCIFLKREGGRSLCSIYPVRPLQCRTWPFWTGVLRSPESWADTACNCPGMNNGQHHNFVRIEQVRTAKSSEDLP